MRLFVLVVVGSLFVGSSANGDPQRGGRNAPPEHRSVQRVEDDVHASVHVVFSSEETRVIRQHYQGTYRSLPPGLQKKLARTGTLPPGWQKKMEPFPVALERRLRPLPSGHHRGVFDGHAVIYLPGGTIVDAAVLF